MAQTARHGLQPGDAVGSRLGVDGRGVRCVQGGHPVTPSVTVALTVTYLSPGKAGRLEATARVRKRGKRLLIVEGEVTQDGDVLADALGTFSVPA